MDERILIDQTLGESDFLPSRKSPSQTLSTQRPYRSEAPQAIRPR